MLIKSNEELSGIVDILGGANDMDFNEPIYNRYIDKY